MFLLNEMLVFTPGRRQEALDRLGWIHGLMASKPGFRRAIVAKYLGDGTSHTVLRIWEDQEAFQRFREGPDGDYGKGRPPGLYTNDQVVPRWTGAFEAGDGSQGSFLVKAQYEVPDDARAAFHENRARLQAAMPPAGGLLALWGLSATDRSEGLIVARYQDRQAFERLLESAEYGTLAQALPGGVNRLATQCFEVVSEVEPG